MNKLMRHSDWAVLSLAIAVYLYVTFETIYSTGGQSLEEKRELYRMMSSTNITLALGLAAILVAVVALNNKELSNEKVKRSLTVGITAYILFILLNSIQLMLSYSNISLELIDIRNMFLVSNICFASSLVSAFSLMKHIIMRVSK